RLVSVRACGLVGFRLLSGAAGEQGPGSCRCAPSGSPCKCFASGSGANSPAISRLWANCQLKQERPLTPPPQSTCRGLLNVAQPPPTGYALAAESAFHQIIRGTRKMVDIGNLQPGSVTGTCDWNL